MASDHWRTRAKGGILRREFLRYAGRAIGWVATVGSGALASDFLTARREQATAKRHYVLKAETGHYRVITGTANLRAGPASLSAVGTGRLL